MSAVGLPPAALMMNRCTQTQRSSVTLIVRRFAIGSIHRPHNGASRPILVIGFPGPDGNQPTLVMLRSASSSWLNGFFFLPWFLWVRPS
jgi:hypothetical protein